MIRVSESCAENGPAQLPVQNSDTCRRKEEMRKRVMRDPKMITEYEMPEEGVNLRQVLELCRPYMEQMC